MTSIGVEKATELGPKDFERLVLRTLTSMKKGDFSVRLPVEFVGVQGKIADTLNDILELNERTALEIERISTVVGKEGKLNQRTQVPSAKDWESSLKESYERNRWSVFVNCWFGNAHENKPMWKNYAGPFGVAIRSTYERLNAALPLAWRSQAVLVGKVSYGDYSSLDYVKDVSDLLNIFMSKPLEYEDERELRAVINEWRLTKEQAAAGLTVGILPHTLVEAVVVAPGSPRWFVDSVSARMQGV